MVTSLPFMTTIRRSSHHENENELITMNSEEHDGHLKLFWCCATAIAFLFVLIRHLFVYVMMPKERKPEKKYIYQGRDIRTC